MTIVLLDKSGSLNLASLDACPPPLQLDLQHHQSAVLPPFSSCPYLSKRQMAVSAWPLEAHLVVFV